MLASSEAIPEAEGLELPCRDASNPSGRLQAGPVPGDVWPAQGESRVWEWVSSAPAFETALS